MTVKKSEPGLDGFMGKYSGENLGKKEEETVGINLGKRVKFPGHVRKIDKLFRR